MQKLKKAVSLQTAFGMYELNEILGEGGSGRVYGGVDLHRKPVACEIRTIVAREFR